MKFVGDLPLVDDPRKLPVIKVIVINGIIFSLSHGGLCMAYSRGSKRRLCVLNLDDDQMIMDPFFNKKDESIITVCMSRFYNFFGAKCWTIPMGQMKKYSCELSSEIFEGVILTEFTDIRLDPVNDKAFLNSQDGTVKVFDLNGYSLIFQVAHCLVMPSPGMMVMIGFPSNESLSVKVRSFDGEQEINDFTYRIKNSENLSCISLSGSLLILDSYNNFHSLDLVSSKSVHRAWFETPSDYLTLHEDHSFLTLENDRVHLCDLNGSVKTEFQDHVLLHGGVFSNQTCLTKDLILSLCGHQPCRCNTGHIHISRLRDGKCVARLCSNTLVQKATIGRITSIFYDEENHEIYAGNDKGEVYVLLQ